MEKEYLDIYSIDGKYMGKKEKKQAHEEARWEYFESGKVSTKHKSIRLLLLTSKGRIILQMRSKWKSDNAGKWDKTIGGHVSSGDDFDLTVSKECSEELGIPTTVVKEGQFSKMVKQTDLETLAVAKRIEENKSYPSHRSSDKGEWVEPNWTVFYLGYYDGGIRFINGESSGIQLFSVEELEEEIKKNPDKFTEDIKYMFKKMKPLIKPIQKQEKTLND